MIILPVVQANGANAKNLYWKYVVLPSKCEIPNNKTNITAKAPKIYTAFMTDLLEPSSLTCARKNFAVTTPGKNRDDMNNASVKL